jgi:hypothetical protein
MIGNVYEMPVPLVLEWEVGSDTVGDFTWPSGGRVAVKQSAFEAMATRLPDLISAPVEMVQDPKLKVPKRKSRSKPRVWLPYQGPPLVELVVDRFVQLLPETTTELVSRCEVCGSESRKLVGVEVKQHKWDPSRQDLVSLVIPRVIGKGLFVPEASAESAPFFRSKDFPQPILCTEKARDLILSLRLTNVDFLEYGEAR